MSGEPPGEWVSVSEAGRRLGISPRAVRNRIKHKSLVARPKGNTGREVFLAEGAQAPDVTREAPRTPPRDVPRDDPGTIDLRLQVTRLEERLAAAELREADQRATVADLRAALEHERQERARLAAELTELRRPWVVRVLEALRRR